MQATEFDKTLNMEERLQMPDLRFIWLPHEQHQFIVGAVVLPPLSKACALGIEPLPEVDFKTLPESTVVRVYEPPPFSSFTTDTKQWVNVDFKNFKETKIGLLSPAERKFLHGAHPSGVLSLEDDLVRLEEMEEAAVLHLMRARFVREHIYTYVGDIVLAYNPFKRIPALYGKEPLMTYKPVHKNPSLKASLPPHVYATAAVAYWNLVNEHINQALIISGESGSGKTENTKFALQLFSEISSSGGASTTPTVGVEEAVMLSNPVLEGFGNAKTVRNDNSSRFGKWMDIVFDKKTGSIIGAEITPYLLEKSRVVGGAGPLERSFHVFYQICTGAPADVKKRLGLTNIGDFEYFAKSVKTVDNIDDKKNYDEMMESFTKLQYTAEEIDAIFRITAAVMHMGNLAVVEKNGGEASDFADTAKATFVAELLGLSVDAYKKANLERQIKTRNEVNTVFYKPSQAIECRDNIAKSMYEALFEWIVVRMNQFLSVSTPPETRLNMGCLDIFGFECFQRNSVEQFLINLTNERLQNHFINHILRTEQEEYKVEGVPCEEIVYKDNTETINFLNVLIENYDEEVMLPKGSDQNLISRLNQKFGGKEKHAFYSQHKLKQTEFIMNHYAGVVSYDVIGFTDKNRDALNDYVFECFNTGNFEVLKSFFKPKVFNDPPPLASGASSKNLTEQKSSGQSSKKKTNTLCGKFQGQLSNLISNIQIRTPHFIRCIKANEVKKPGIHDSAFVLNQIRYSGLLEIIKIRTAGFAYRRPFANFCERFDMLLRPVERKTLSVSERVMRIKAKAIPPEIESCFMVGKTKIFYREQALKALQEALINKRSEMSTMLQSLARRVVMRRKFVRVQVTLRAALDLMETSNLPALKDLIKQSANLESIELVMPKLNSLADYLAQEIPLCEEIRLALNEPGPEKLLAAMKKSDKLEMGVKTMNDKVIELLKKAEEQRKIYVKQEEARQKLLASMKVVDVATVEEALKEAKDIKIPEKHILADAEKYIAELKKEDEIFAKMIASIDTKKIDVIEKAYLDCTAIERTNAKRQEALEKVRNVMVQFYEHILNSACQSQKEPDIEKAMDICSKCIVKEKLVQQCNVAKKVLFDIRERKRLEEERRRQEEERKRLEAELAAERKRKEEEMRQMDEEQRRAAEEEMKAAEEKRRQELKEAEEQKRKELEERRMAEYLERKAAAEEARQKHIDGGGDPNDPAFAIPEPPPPLPVASYNADEFIVIAPSIGGGFSDEKDGGFSFAGSTGGGLDDYLSLVPGGTTDGQPALGSADTVTGDIDGGHAIDIHGSRSRRTPMKPRNKKIIGFSFLVVGIVLLILAGLSLRYAEDRITSQLAVMLPVRNTTLKYFSNQPSTLKYYVWDYNNLAAAVSGSALDVKERGPFSVKKTEHWYNVSFLDNAGTKTVRFMKRESYEFDDVAAAQSTYVTVPALQYASAIGSVFPEGVSDRLGAGLSNVENFFSTDLAEFLKKFSFSLYLEQVQINMGSNFVTNMKNWGQQANVQGLQPLNAPLSAATVSYLVNSTSYSLLKRSLDTTSGIGAWLLGNQKSAIVTALESLESGKGAANYDAISSWINSTLSSSFSSSYFSYVKSRLVSLNVISNVDIASVTSFKSLGLLQFAQAKILPVLSSNKYQYAREILGNNILPTAPQSGTLELSGSIKEFAPKLLTTTVSLSQAVAFFANLNSPTGEVLVSALWSSVSHGVTTVSSRLSSCGVTSDNMAAVASYLKSLVRFNYFKAAGFSSTVNVPPASNTDRGLFIRTSVYDLLSGLSDPNLKAGTTLSSESYLADTFLESYADDEEHWNEHAGEYTVLKTGRVNLSQVHEYFSISGKTALRGVWKSEENILGVRNWYSAEPKHLNEPVNAYEVWDDTLLRSVEYKKGGSSSLNNFDVYRYSPASSAFQNQSVNPLNEKYYMSGPSGLLNMDAATNGAPVWYSQPHFLYVDNDVTDSFIPGTFVPDESSHSSYVDIEPETGAAFKRANRYQLNLKLSKVDWFTEPGYSGLFSTSDDLYAPVMWFEESWNIPSARSTEFNDNINDVRRRGKGACAGLAIFGIIFVLVGAYLVYRARKDQKSMFTTSSKPAEIEAVEVAV